MAHSDKTMLSNKAVFHISGKFKTTADHVLGLEVLTNRSYLHVSDISE
jgi:hypothetical protein